MGMACSEMPDSCRYLPAQFQGQTHAHLCEQFLLRIKYLQYCVVGNNRLFLALPPTEPPHRNVIHATPSALERVNHTRFLSGGLKSFDHGLHEAFFAAVGFAALQDSDEGDHILGRFYIPSVR
jgi:hypothetical protein